MKLARSLGWFSIGLGVTEIVAPGRLSELIGIDEHPTLMRAFGLREAASGIGILLQDHPTESVWSRVGGDGLDLAFLGAAMASNSSNKKRLIAVISAVAGVTALDLYCGIRLAQTGKTRYAKSAITINRPQSEVFAFWRESDNLNRCIRSIPGGVRIVDARPDEYLEFRSLDGRFVKSAAVTFQPAFGRDGTEIHVVVDGFMPVRQLHEDVRRTKRMIETGEIPTTEGQSAGPQPSALIARMIHRFEGKEVA